MATNKNDRHTIKEIVNALVLTATCQVTGDALNNKLNVLMTVSGDTCQDGCSAVAGFGSEACSLKYVSGSVVNDSQQSESNNMGICHRDQKTNSAKRKATAGSPIRTMKRSIAIGAVAQIGKEMMKQEDYVLPWFGDNVVFGKHCSPRQLETVTADEMKQLGIFECQPGTLIDNKYEVKELVGRGVFSVVAHAKDVSSGSNVALKFIHNNPGAIEAYEREFLTLRKCDSPFVITMIATLQVGDQFVVVLPLLKSDLYQFMLLDMDTSVSLSTTKSIAYQALQAISYLTDHEIVHSDVKPENMLLADYSYVRTEEFGRSVRSLKNPSIMLSDLNSVFDTKIHSDFAQTMHYRAPEVIIGTQWDYKIDVFSVGLLLYELVACETLIPDELPDYEKENMDARMLHLCVLEACTSSRPQLIYESPFRDIHILVYKTMREKVAKLQHMTIADQLEAQGLPFSEQTVRDFKMMLYTLLEMDCRRRPSATDALQQLDFISDRKFQHVATPKLQG